MCKMATKFSMERADSKFETRNPKSETNPNVPNSKVFSWFVIFELLDFEFVSDFDIRNSDFSILLSCLVLAVPA